MSFIKFVTLFISLVGVYLIWSNIIYPLFFKIEEDIFEYDEDDEDEYNGEYDDDKY